jgi:hypothetical protein
VPGLAAVEGGRRTAPRGGVVAPLLGIDVDQIEHPSQTGHAKEVLRHGGRKHQPVPHRPRPQHALHPGRHAGVRVVDLGAGTRRQQATETAQARQPRRQARRVYLAAGQLAQRGQVARIVRGVDEAADVHTVPARQVAQQVIGPNLVALVRRERQAVGEEQDFVHGELPPGALSRDCAPGGDLSRWPWPAACAATA